MSNDRSAVGLAYPGIESVPSAGTWVLDPGERVVSVGIDPGEPGGDKCVLSTMVRVSARRTGKSLLSERHLQEFQIRFDRWKRRNRYLVVVVAEEQRLRKRWEVSSARPSRMKHLQKLKRYACRVKAVRGIQ